jgi:hypothetical protein
VHDAVPRAFAHGRRERVAQPDRATDIKETNDQEKEERKNQRSLDKRLRAITSEK